MQESIRFFFETFRRTASACGVVKAFRQKGLLFPRRLKKGPNKGDLVWAELPHSRTLHTLHNPRYTGAFVYGRSRTRNNPNGGTSYTRLPCEQWMLLKNAHPGYISWEQYEENLRRLQENAHANGADRRKSPPREGPALLQGSVVCGICGSRMTVRYHARQEHLVPEYVCQRDGIEHAISICQRVVGDHIDNAVANFWWKASLRWRSKSHCRSNRNSKRESKRWTSSARNRWKEHVMKPTWPSAAIFTSIPRTVWSRIRSRRTGHFFFKAFLRC